MSGEVVKPQSAERQSALHDIQKTNIASTTLAVWIEHPDVLIKVANRNSALGLGRANSSRLSAH